MQTEVFDADIKNRNARINARVASLKAGVEIKKMQVAIDTSWAVVNKYKNWKRGFDKLCDDRWDDCR